MVAKAFAMMDKNGSGTITVEDVISIYDVSKNPDFIEKRLTKEQMTAIVYRTVNQILLLLQTMSSLFQMAQTIQLQVQVLLPQFQFMVLAVAALHLTLFLRKTFNFSQNLNILRLFKPNHI